MVKARKIKTFLDLDLQIMICVFCMDCEMAAICEPDGTQWLNPQLCSMLSNQKLHLFYERYWFFR